MKTSLIPTEPIRQDELVSTSPISTEHIDFLDDLFPQCNPKLTKIDYVGTVSVFSFLFDSETLLNEKWRTMTKSIAAYYQAEFEGEEKAFERWNIYILFLVKESVSAQLMHKIENDKFSSRKIVRDNIGDTDTMDVIRRMIDENIINSDLEHSTRDIRKSFHQQLDYSSNSTVYQIIADSHIRMSNKTSHVEEMENLHQQLVKNITYEVQKSRDTSI